METDLAHITSTNNQDALGGFGEGAGGPAPSSTHSSVAVEPLI